MRELRSETYLAESTGSCRSQSIEPNSSGRPCSIRVKEFKSRSWLKDFNGLAVQVQTTDLPVTSMLPMIARIVS